MRAAILMLLAACNLYDPDLGSTPFLCGTDEPRCPDGYTPVDVASDRCECRKGAPDAPAFYPCNGDTSEPNEGLSAATPTRIGVDVTDSFPNLAICPASDVDVFAVTIVESTTLLTATATYDPGRHAPVIDFLDAGGVSLNPEVRSPQPGVLVASFTLPSPGTYYVHIKATQSVNYGLRLDVIPPT